VGGGIAFGLVVHLNAVDRLAVVEHAHELMRAAAQGSLAVRFAPQNLAAVPGYNVTKIQ
jgi:hypothetical protein